MEMYSIYDRKLREYGSIVLAANDAAVVRMVKMGIRPGEDTVMSKFPEDFEVHRVGSFDPSTGEIVADGRPVVTAQLAQVLEVRKDVSDAG